MYGNKMKPVNVEGHVVVTKGTGQLTLHSPVKISPAFTEPS
jgi:hypothetical protein